MIINMIKQPGGALTPASDRDSEALSKFKTGEMYPVELKRSRNPSFHRKVFTFFQFCFEHWKGTAQVEFMNEAAQFDVFRKNLTVLAGYYDSFYTITGEVRIEARSLNFGSMSQEEFEAFYIAVTGVAMRKIFKTADANTYNRLIGFF